MTDDDAVAEHAARFDEMAGDYDESAGENEVYRACVALTVEAAAPGPDDTVLDVGAGTGAVGLALAADAGRVLLRDPSEGMLAEAEEKVAERSLGNVEVGRGTFRDPAVGDAEVDVVVSNFAMHHLDDDAKRAAVGTLAALGPRRIVLGDIMFFGETDAEAPFYDPAVDSPSTVGLLADAFTDAGYALTAVEYVHDAAGVLVAERLPDGSGGAGATGDDGTEEDGSGTGERPAGE
jgi:SAM-dependent methyltransferase